MLYPKNTLLSADLYMSSVAFSLSCSASGSVLSLISWLMVLELPRVLCVCAAALATSGWSKSSRQSLVLGWLLPGELYLSHLGEAAAGTAFWIGRRQWMMLQCINISRKGCCSPVVAASFSAAYLIV